MDQVFIRDLAIDTVIGVYDWERRVRQTLLLDLEMATEIHAAAGSDDLQFALDYSRVAEVVSDLAANSEFQLIEALAERIAELVLSEFGVPWLRLRLRKPGAVRNAREVGLLIERGERPG